MSAINSIMEDKAFDKTLERMYKAKQAGKKKTIEEEIERIERELENEKNWEN